MRRCPVCQDTLVRRTITDTLEVEGCTSCGGIWLTNGQLKQAASSAEQLISLDESFPVSAIALNNGARHVCPFI